VEGNLKKKCISTVK